MRKIVVGMYAGQCGTDGWEFFEVPDTVTDDELTDFAWQCGKDHAEMYGIYPLYEYQELSEEEISEDELDSDDYSDNIEGWWEEYDAEKHDGYRIGDSTHWNQY